MNQEPAGSQVLHTNTEPHYPLVFTSDNFRYLTLVQRDWWWYCSDWTCERFSFCAQWGLNWIPLISSPSLDHCAMVASGFTSYNFRYLTLVQRYWWWYCSYWTCDTFSFFLQRALNWGPLDLESCNLPLCHSNFWFSPLTISGTLIWCRGIGGGIVLIGPVTDFLFSCTGVWTGDIWISSPALYHCATATSGFHLWYNFRYLTLVQRNWWWYCSDWTCDWFSVSQHQGLNWEPLDL